MKAWWRRVRPNILPSFLIVLVRLLVRTLRWRLVNVDVLERTPAPRIVWTWHGRLLIPSLWYRGNDAYALISPSRDGEILARLFDRLGYKQIRGSTRRGGIQAAIEGIRLLRDGNEIVMTPDGPRGPNRKIQEGLILIAQKSGAPVISVGVSVSPRKLANSWDRALIPMPFAKAVMVFGEPRHVAPDLSQGEKHALVAEMEREIDGLELRAREISGEAR